MRRKVVGGVKGRDWDEETHEKESCWQQTSLSWIIKFSIYIVVTCACSSFSVCLIDHDQIWHAPKKIDPTTTQGTFGGV